LRSLATARRGGFAPSASNDGSGVAIFEETGGGAANSEALQSALGVVEARAQYDGPQRKVFVRIGSEGDTIYLDLADAEWRAVEISSAGWRVVAQPPVRFHRAKAMAPLPLPIHGGSLTDLRPFLNLRPPEKDQPDVDFILTLGWMLAAFRPAEGYPVGAISGEQGTAKSTFARLVRACIDPSTAPLRALPREDRDLYINASNSHVLAYDNISTLSAWVSDALCQLSTGGGLGTRALYTDNEETILTAARPILLNGIESGFISRPDLIDRIINLRLEPIADEQRKPEAVIWAQFERQRPGILGALCDAVSTGLRMLPTTTLSRFPRMADVALWISACESALWKPGTFMAVYDANRKEAVEAAVEGDLVASTLRKFIEAGALGLALAPNQTVENGTVWVTTAAALEASLSDVATEKERDHKDWPKSPRGLRARLERVAPALRKLGIDIFFERKAGTERTRTILISRRPDNEGQQPSQPSQPSQGAEKGRKSAANGEDGWWDGREEQPSQPSQEDPRKSASWDGRDGRDGRLHTQSGADEEDIPPGEEVEL
jgi:hypothetical protein